MKVLHIGKYFPPFKGGVETYLRDVMTAMVPHGVDSAALVHQHRSGFGTREETVSTPDGGVFSVCRAGVWFRLAFTPVSPAFRGLLARRIRDWQPDVVHIHLPNPSACWLLGMPAAADIPWIVHWHSDVVTARQNKLLKMLYAAYRPFERRLLKRARVIVATSESYLTTSDSLAEYPEKCQVIPLGLDPERIAPAGFSPADGASSDAGLRVLAVGRLTYYKGFEYLVQAAAQLAGVEVHIVGRGEQHKALSDLIDGLGLGERVVLHGGVSDVRLAQLLQSCDCLCLPSIERTEAFGLVLLEAMMFGKATVVSDVPGSGMGWIVVDGETGITVPPANVEALVHALRYLADHVAERLAMGAAGRRRFEQNFDIRQSVLPLLEVYRKVIHAH